MFTFITITIIIAIIGLLSQKGSEVLLCKEDKWEKSHSVDVDLSDCSLPEEKELNSYKELGISLSSIGLVVSAITCAPVTGQTICLVEQKETFFSPWDEELRLGL